ncbi:MAG: hypothetical protein IIY52_03930 [Solobacterium sp.]|nr:hypothetical protein [Solobacterium sp.]
MEFIGIFLLAMIVITIGSIRRAQQTVVSGRRPVSSDGHEVPPEEDLTVNTSAGHYAHREHNEDDFGRRYIVHNEPVQGYVILNGIMWKLEDCKDL